MTVSTIGPVATAIAQALEANGIDADGVFAQVGIDTVSVRDPNYRLPFDVMNRLVALAIRRTQCPSFGLQVADYIHPTTLYALGMAMYSSSTLRDFLEEFVRYYRLVTTKESLTTETVDDCLCLCALPETEADLEPGRIDATAAIFIKVIRSALRADFCPARVELPRVEPEGCRQEYEGYFGAPVTFSRSHLVIWIKLSDLDEPLPAAHPELVSTYKLLVEEYLSKLDKADFPGRVRKELTRLLPTGVSGKEEVAEALCMSTRTLYNKLESAGVTFREVLDETRRTMAEEYIRQNIPVFEIAYLTGFSDTGSFSRAFKKWTGKSPSEFREQAEEGEE